MATLHIEHPISDLETWLGAFNRFEEARRNAGVRSQRVHRPVDDDKYIYLQLEFDSVEEAAAFKSSRRPCGHPLRPRPLSPAPRRRGS